jgi:LysM repeat protein
MRAWLKLACVVLAWTILPAAVASAGQDRPVRPAQVSTRTTNISFTSAHSAARPASAALTSITAAPVASTALAIRANLATTSPAETTPARTYAVQRGDTLSAISARFGVRGGWPALYAANRSAIGADPDAVHAGIRLTIPSPATSPGSGSVPGNRAPNGTASDETVPRSPAPGQPRPSTQPASPAPVSPPVAHPGRPQPQSHASSDMPSWLMSVLLAVGLLALVVFAAELLLLAWRGRRRRGVIPAPPPRQTGLALEPHQESPVLPPHQAAQATQTTPLDNSVSEISVMPVPAHEGRIERARIVMADHDRLVVTRNKQDDTICVLCPPGENPADILRVARLVLPEGHYGKLAEHLGLPANWPMNQ